MNIPSVLRKNQLHVVLIDFMACIAILATHLTNYILYIGYSRVFPDLIILFGLLGFSALLLTLALQVHRFYLREFIYSCLILVSFSDTAFSFGTTGEGLFLGIGMVVISLTLLAVFLMKQHLNKILLVVFGTMLISTIGLDITSSLSKVALPTSTLENSPQRPVVIHLVLDEHIGGAGLKAGIAEGTQFQEQVYAFYVDNGFRLFGDAYSEYFNTHSSIASAFNSDESETPEALVSRFRNKFVLDENKYFSAWLRRGYRINVLQSSYLNMCASNGLEVASCKTYKHDAFDEKAIASLPTSERLKLIGKMYFSSFTIIKLVRLSNYLVGGDAPFSLPLWHGRVGPLSSVTPFAEFIEQVSKSNGGDFFFAHLLMPHYPYVFQSDCSVRSPVSSWKLRTGRDGINTVQQRDQAYREYFEQITCTMRKLNDLFDAMKANGTFDDATIIIHGDHGARISRILINEKNADQLTHDDFLDAFSTLFAIKTPKTQSGIDSRMASLTDLINFSLNIDERDVIRKSNHHVYLPGDDGAKKISIKSFSSP